MERRSFLTGAAAGTAAAGTLATPAIAQGQRELRMVTTWPKNFPGLGTGAQRIADRITAITDGALTVRLYASGELVPPFESFDAVGQGTADLYHGASYYWQGKNLGFNFFAAVPFGLTASELEAWVHYGGGQALWDELSEPFNVKPFLGGNTGSQMGGWFRKEVGTVEDIQGLKIRMPGLGGEVMRRVGAAAISLPGGEIFPSLQSGAIDATEWVGPWNDLAFGFYRIAKFYYYPGMHEPGTGLDVGINLDVWNSLTNSQRAAVEAACHAENDTTLAEFNAQNGAALDTLLTQHDVQLRRFSDEIYSAFATAAQEVLNETGAADSEITRKIFTSFADFRKKAVSWTALSDSAYTDLRGTYLPEL